MHGPPPILVYNYSSHSKSYSKIEFWLKRNKVNPITCNLIVIKVNEIWICKELNQLHPTFFSNVCFIVQHSFPVLIFSKSLKSLLCTNGNWKFCSILTLAKFNVKSWVQICETFRSIFETWLKFPLAANFCSWK